MIIERRKKNKVDPIITPVFCLTAFIGPLTIIRKEKQSKLVSSS